jgi:hypothetical protein
MGNCLGKKATNVATPADERSLDVNTPKVAKVQSETQPTTPETDVEAAASIAKSFSKDDAVSTLSQVASNKASVITTGGKRAVSKAVSTGEMARSSTTNSVVNTAPSTDTATDLSEMHVKSTIQTMPTEVTEVEKPKSFMDTVDGFYDKICGAEVGSDREQNPYNVVQNSSIVSESTSSIVPVLSADSTEAASTVASAAPSTGLPRAASTTSSVVSYKQQRKLNKKLREIEAIEAKDPESLTPEQTEKLATKEEVLQSLATI